MHAAKLADSPRLQRVLAFLRQRGKTGATTFEIINGANVVAVNSAVAELRVNGHEVNCSQERSGDARIYRYVLTEFVQ